jgi:hypothetical protein
VTRYKVTISGETAEELRNNILALARTYEGSVPTLHQWIDAPEQESTDVEQIEAPVEEVESVSEETEQDFPTDAVCRHCTEPLKVPDNWYPSAAVRNYRCCKGCFNDGSQPGRKAGDKKAKKAKKERKQVKEVGETSACNTCGEVLTEENWYPSQRANNFRRCKACQNTATSENRRRRRNLAANAERRWGRPQSPTEEAEEPVSPGQPVFNAEATYEEVLGALRSGGSFQSTHDMAFISSVNTMLQRFAEWSPTDFIYAENEEGGATLIWMTMDACPSLADISISDF